MREPIIQPIFPTPIVISQLERDWSQEEKTFFAHERSKQAKNIGNRMSVNNAVLHEPEMAELKAEIDTVLKQYVDNIIDPVSPDIEVYITQSWLNYTKAGEWHHKHTHSNSYLSGVLYVASEEEVDKISFMNNTYRTIKIPAKENNHFNAEQWYFTVKTGLLVIFPSWLEHMVDMKTTKENNTRISLAFNTFVRGTLGENKALTELKL